ncbi:hypothetical protein WJ968_17770 [Achromobacter xylosoxidans]
MLLVAGILCIAMALRAPVTGVAPLIGMIRAQLGLSSTAAGMLITLPLLAFAAGSLAAAGLARRYGLERTLFGALLLIAAGIVGTVRSDPRPRSTPAPSSSARASRWAMCCCPAWSSAIFRGAWPG